MDIKISYKSLEKKKEKKVVYGLTYFFLYGQYIY